MGPRWDDKNKRWECSIGSGKARRWFRCRVEGPEGKAICQAKKDQALDGPKPMKPGTLGEFVESVWWPRAKARTTKGTRTNYRSVLGKHIAPFYGWMLEDIRLEHLQPWVSNLEGEPKTVRNIYRVLSGVLDLAHKTGRYSRLDHKLVQLPELGERWAASGLEPENIAKLLAEAKGSVFYGPVWAAAMLGLRRNEVCGLKKGHVKLLEDYAILSIQDNRQIGIETNKLKSKKQGEARVIELPRFLGEKLLSFGAGHDGIYLFHGVEGKPICPNAVTACMKPLCERAKVPVIHFKDLRAACRSNLSAQGVSEDVIMQILGHSTYQTSLMYQDRRGSRQSEALSRLASTGDS